MTIQLNKLHPLHEMEELFYYLTEGGRSGNASDVIVLDGPLDRNLLEQSIRLWLGRHSVLNSLLVKRGRGKLYWQVQEKLAPPELQYSQLGTDDERAVFEHLTTQAWSRGFDVERERPIRFHYTATPSRHYFQVITSRLYTDGTTGAIMTRELCEVYNALHRGEAWDPAPRELTFPADKLFLQHLPLRRRVQLAAFAVVEFLRDLFGSGRSLSLPKVPRGKVRMQRLHFSPELLPKLRAFAKANHCTVHVGFVLSFVRACQAFNASHGTQSRHIRLMDLFSLRRFAREPIDHVFGSLAVPYKMRVSVTGSDADLIKAIQGRLDELKSGRILAYLHVWSALIALARLLPVEQAASWVNRLEPTNIMLSNPGPTGEGLSTMGTANVVDLIDHPYLYPPERLFVIMSTFRGTLRATMLFDEAAFPRGVEEFMHLYVAELERLAATAHPPATSAGNARNGANGVATRAAGAASGHAVA